jgi:hypothetical protein
MKLGENASSLLHYVAEKINRDTVNINDFKQVISNFYKDDFISTRNADINIDVTLTDMLKRKVFLQGVLFEVKSCLRKYSKNSSKFINNIFCFNAPKLRFKSDMVEDSTSTSLEWYTKIFYHTAMLGSMTFFIYFMIYKSRQSAEDTRNSLILPVVYLLYIGNEIINYYTEKAASLKQIEDALEREYEGMAINEKIENILEEVAFLDKIITGLSLYKQEIIALHMTWGVGRSLK